MQKALQLESQHPPRTKRYEAPLLRLRTTRTTRNLSIVGSPRPGCTSRNIQNSEGSRQYVHWILEIRLTKSSRRVRVAHPVIYFYLPIFGILLWITAFPLDVLLGLEFVSVFMFAFAFSVVPVFAFNCKNRAFKYCGNLHGTLANNRNAHQCKVIWTNYSKFSNVNSTIFHTEYC